MNRRDRDQVLILSVTAVALIVTVALAVITALPR